MTKTKLVNPNLDIARKGAAILESTFDAFGIRTKVAEVDVNETEIIYRLKIAEGTKSSLFHDLEPDIALAMASSSGHVKIVAPVPGTNFIAIHVPITDKKNKVVEKYKIIETTKTIELPPATWSGLIRDTTSNLFMQISRYSQAIALVIDDLGRGDQK